MIDRSLLYASTVWRASSESKSGSKQCHRCGSRSKDDHGRLSFSLRREIAALVLDLHSLSGNGQARGRQRKSSEKKLSANQKPKMSGQFTAQSLERQNQSRQLTPTILQFDNKSTTEALKWLRLVRKSDLSDKIEKRRSIEGRTMVRGAPLLNSLYLVVS